MGQFVMTWTPFDGERPQWHRGLSRYGDEISDWRPVWKEIAKDYALIEMRQFDSEGSSGLGKRWKPLSKGYAKWKRQHYGDKPILELTGAMRHAAINPQVRMDKTSLEMTIGDRKAIWHQRGHTSPTPLPRRPVVMLTEADKRRWFKLMQSYVIDVTRKPWGSAAHSVAQGLKSEI